MNLYRKHRPQKFTDLYGQDHVVQTITNALSSGNFAHAYLFAGPKGSGKTTTARLLAKALNCQGRVLGKDSFEPCNKCISCKEISAGNNLDMVEIDAASNRGIDEIRDLREKIRFAPTVGKYKIYIIDECHMLTKEAFNALLKTLEEPPAHAVFVLATTELHKVPATILSRAQSFEFKKASIEEILKLLKKIAKLENIKIDEESLKLIARLSYGAFRDAVSMLDQVAALGTNGRHTIGLEEVQNVLGQTTENLVWEFAQNLAQNNRQKSLKLIEKIYYEGKDLENFIAETVALFRKVMLSKEGLVTDFEATKEEQEKLKEIADNLEISEIVLIIEKLSTSISQVKTSVLGQLPLEMAVFELTKGQQIQNQKVSIKNEENKKDTEKQEPKVVEMKTVEKKIIENKPAVVTKNVQWWPQVIKEVKSHNNTLAALLGGAKLVGNSESQINLAVRFKFHADQICSKKNLAVVEECVLKVSGNSYKVECIVDKNLELIKPLDDEEVLLNSAKEVFELEES